MPQLEVEDTGEAILRMAREFRQSWNAPVVGITGSCGKTTCKELLRLMLGSERTLSTQGNLNNLIGVPMSVLRPEATEARYAVLEAGISEPGEMARLAEVIDPDWVVVTAIGPAHLRDLGSVANVAMEKGRLAGGKRVKTVLAGESCEPFAGYLGGTKVCLVRPDPHLDEEWSYRFSSVEGATRLQQRVFGEVVDFEYAGLGKGLASNVALAVAAAKSMCVSTEGVREGLAQWRSPDLRGQWVEREGSRILLDCYNANPMSMQDALATFVDNTPDSEPRLFVVGCMEELGGLSVRYHEKLGEELPFRKEDFLLVLGDEAASVLRGMKTAGYDMDRCAEVSSAREVGERLASFSGSVFLKGSRRYCLEEALSC